MIDWIFLNWLAFYGAVVGTIALAVNVFRFRHVVNKEKVKISVTVKDHPDKERNLRRLEEGKEKKNWERPDLAEAYEITIRNIGSVSAYIEDAGVICENKKSHAVLVSSAHNSYMLTSIDEVGQIEIAPKSYKKLSVYFSRDEELFTAKKGYVIDATGRQKTVKAG